MTLEEFSKRYCFGCGSQRCTGVYSEFARGCLYYNTVLCNKEEPLHDVFLQNVEQEIQERLAEILRRQ